MLNGFSSSNRPYRSSRPSLYQRSERRWVREYSLPKRYDGDGPSMRSRNGVEPAEPLSPTGWTSETVRHNWSAAARRMASPRAPVTSRWAVRPRRYVTGNTSLGAKTRNAVTPMLTEIRTATMMSLGESTPRWSRASATSTTSPATTHFRTLRRRPTGTSV